ncbi:MAG: hypothetical protein KatS3mg057_2432 [Herpetosiphonaceae bacterium]|nr:MAG: hypothetical protein KatS3mg057_2432 [Herpetosiphonaceae bacterium]
MLILPPKVVATITRHAQATYPYECCGLLLGSFAPRRVVRVFPGSNISRQNSTDRYTLDPRDFAAADRHAGQVGLEIVGFYHSHPDVPALPSEEDRALAWPDYLYLIASISAGTMVDLRAWIFSGPERHYQELDLAWRDISG